MVTASRDELFRISGIRGSLPQFFFSRIQPIEDLDHDSSFSGETTFIGCWDTIEAINDASSLPDEILEANPNIETWATVFDKKWK
jgi:hypothetical protein